MDYGKIIRDSFEIAWRYKSLWVFGLFAGGGGSGFNFDTADFDLPQSEFGGSGFGGSSSLPFDMSWEILLPLIFLVGVMVLGFLIMHLISMPALIDGVNRIKRGGTYSLGSSFSVGVDFFWRFLGLLLLSLLTLLVVVFVMVIIGVIANAIGGTALLILSLLALIPLGLFFLFAFSNVIALSERAMVVRNIGIADGLEEGMLLFKRNLVKNLVLFLIEIGFSIAFGIGAMIVWGILGTPIALMALATGAGWAVAIGLAIIIGLPISIIIGGFTGTVLQNFYTLFYFELVEPTPQATPAAPAPPAAPA